jgi:single-stranded-DNA-specific exonuclease
MNQSRGSSLYSPITPSEIEQKLQQRFVKDGFLSLTHLPHPSTFKDMDRATKRIVKAIKKQERIVLIGDYDVDGVVSTTLIKDFFDRIGVELEWIIPNRFRDGYGLSVQIIERIQDFDLAITVDNGIAAVEAAKVAKAYQIDLIITDHHLLPPTLPQAYAIIDQKQPECNFPYEEVCGAQIAWYLIASLNKALNAQVEIKPYIALVAIAIIADMMPLQHINRSMVVAGLKLLSKREFPAISALMERLDKEILNAEDIGFQIAPLLNSAGRMDDAKWSVEFLLSRNIYDARVRLERLVDFNEKRKATEQKITDEALSMAREEDSVIVVAGEHWHEGVVGIVAARVARHYQKPTIILTKGKHGELKGSGRSFGVCNLFRITQRSQSLLSKFGGHHAAIGLSLLEENLSSFREAIQQSYLQESYPEISLDPDILGELSFSHITSDLVAMMRRYEPFGQANVRPKFITSDVIIEDVTIMGKDREHRRLSLLHDNRLLTAVFFKTKEHFEVGQVVDIIYTINENIFNNRRTLQLLVDKLIV